MKPATARNVVIIIKLFVILLIVGTIIGVLQKNKQSEIPTKDITAEKQFMSQVDQLKRKGYIINVDYVRKRVCGSYILHKDRANYIITYCDGWETLPSQASSQVYKNMIKEVDYLAEQKGFRRIGYFE